jgi:hypothetical protein
VNLPLGERKRQAQPAIQAGVARSRGAGAPLVGRIFVRRSVVAASIWLKQT